MKDYNELKALAEMACPGPWMQENDDLYFNDDGYTRHMMFTDSGHDVCDDECCDDGHRDNLKFIAAANPAAVLALIAENEFLRADARRFRFIVDCPIRVHVALSRLADGSDDFDLAAECDRFNSSPENP
jgi:hypothetical protein